MNIIMTFCLLARKKAIFTATKLKRLGWPIKFRQLPKNAIFINHASILFSIGAKTGKNTAMNYFCPSWQTSVDIILMHTLPTQQGRKAAEEPLKRFENFSVCIFVPVSQTKNDRGFIISEPAGAAFIPSYTHSKITSSSLEFERKLLANICPQDSQVILDKY